MSSTRKSPRLANRRMNREIEPESESDYTLKQQIRNLRVENVGLKRQLKELRRESTSSDGSLSSESTLDAAGDDRFALQHELLSEMKIPELQVYLYGVTDILLKEMDINELRTYIEELISKHKLKIFT